MGYDVGVLAALAFFTWRGSSKGFVWQVATIAAIVLCFCFAGPASAVLAPQLGLQAPLDRWVSMLILYVACSFACFLAARSLKKGIEKIDLEHYDSHLGAVFGFLKGATLCLVITFFAVTLAPASHPYVLGSYSGYASAIVFDELRPVVPDDYHGYLDESLKKLGQGGLDSEAGAGGATLAEQSGDDADSSAGEEAIDDATTIVERLLSELPSDNVEEMRGLLDGLLSGVEEAVRDERLADLRDATPEQLADLVAVWQTGLTPAEQERRRDLLFGVVGVYTSFPAAQQSIADEIAGQLQGVPPRVQLGVLEDWHADLLDPPSDPDPATTPLTSLDQRINRQLDASDVARESLDQALRDRLELWR